MIMSKTVSPGQKPELVPPTDANIARAADLLRAGAPAPVSAGRAVVGA